MLQSAQYLHDSIKLSLKDDRHTHSSPFVTFSVFSVIWSESVCSLRGCRLTSCSSPAVLSAGMQPGSAEVWWPVCPYTVLTACSALWDELLQPAPTLNAPLTPERWVSSELLSEKPIWKKLLAEEEQQLHHCQSSFMCWESSCRWRREGGDCNTPQETHGHELLFVLKHRHQTRHITLSFLVCDLQIQVSGAVAFSSWTVFLVEVRLRQTAAESQFEHQHSSD